MSIKVMLADDHVLMREGIRQLLEFDGTISVIAEANNGVECMEQLLSIHPDILLLDINMPVMNGIEVLQEIKKKNISVKVLVLTVHNEVEYLLKAVDIGVDGYIMKDAESADLKKAINCIMQGETYIQPSLVPALNSRLVSRDIDKGKINSLTNRELFRMLTCRAYMRTLQSATPSRRSFCRLLRRSSRAWSPLWLPTPSTRRPA